MSAKNKKAKKTCNNIAAPVQLPAGEHYVLTVQDYNLIQDHIGQINAILARSRVNGNIRESATGTVPAQNVTTAVSENLTDAVVKRLVGHTNVVYYNCETNAWNTNKYNGYTISSQDTDTKRVKEFKSAMEEIPEFNQQYEFAASVTMIINKASFPGWSKPINNPQYSNTGTAVVGNIIVKNKATGKYELYCKSWVGVGGYLNPLFAVSDGAFWFAFIGARYSDFRAAVCACHVR